MTIDDSIGRFPDLRAAYEGSKAIVGDLRFLAQLMADESKIGDPTEGRVIYLARIMSQLGKKLKAESKPIRELEAELAGLHDQPIRIGEHTTPCAACWAIDLAFRTINQLTIVLNYNKYIRAILVEEDSTRGTPNNYDSQFVVAVAYAAIPDTYLHTLVVDLDPYWTALSDRIRDSRSFQEEYRNMTMPMIVSDLKRLLGGPASMEALEAAIEQEFVRCERRRESAARGG
jgi:hypothetical protein